MQTEEPLHQLSSSPSFSSYSSETFAQIAARVIHELSSDPRSLDDTLFQPWDQNDNLGNDDVKVDVDVSDDFEFSSISRDPNSSPVSADDIFHNGQIRPIYPLFGREASVSPVPTTNGETAAAEVGSRRRRLPLRKLMFEEGETENDGNELDGVAAGTYCEWTPRCKKSSSTGSSSSKRWKLRDLLLRSHSDGKKEPLLFLGPTKRTNKVAPKHGGSAENGGAGAAKGVNQSQKKSFLPYRQELVALFSN
ncbi:uncharacterized protein LOC133309974 [Gastrolobium bilobum]|uniref:uncharacterized protein LOC133309974 n=1 Tax=Gastrolobium bilobum TaxID=150636 RepID=UPI002AB16919|nr:uncharacterized protein LOC133309974 [Gastrolobium bilobum]